MLVTILFFFFHVAFCGSAKSSHACCIPDVRYAYVSIHTYIQTYRESERETYVWCQSLKRWARTQDRVQGGCCFTTSRYSSAISHTGGLHPSNSAGLWRFPSKNNPNMDTEISFKTMHILTNELGKQVFNEQKPVKNQTQTCIIDLHSLLPALLSPECSAPHHSGAECCHLQRLEYLLPSCSKNTPNSY